MNIDGLTNGTVIDHITAGRGMRIYELLRLDKLDCTVAISQNATSSKHGRKDIIKVDTMMDLDLDILGYVDNTATVNIIRNGSVVKKINAELPETLTNVIHCHNPRCITSVEQGINHVFRLVNKETRSYRCVYCDTEYRERSDSPY